MSQVESTPEPTKPKKRSPLTFIAPIVLIVAAYFGFKAWDFSQHHESTDNAQVAGDLVQLAPQVAGKIALVAVKENQHVQKGQLLYELDPAKYQAAVEQAKANLQSAIADAKSAGADVGFTQAASAAGLVESQGVTGQAGGGVETAESQILGAQASVENASATVRSAGLDIQDAIISEQTAKQSLSRAQEAVKYATANLQSAKSSLAAAQSSVDSAQAQADLAAKNRERSRVLAQEGAISKTQFDQTDAALKTANANLASVMEQVKSAESQVSARESDLASAKDQVGIAKLSITQAANKVSTARQKLQIAKSGQKLTQAQLESAKGNLTIARSKAVQTQGQKQQAEVAVKRVSLKQAASEQALAKVALARAALNLAQLDLDHTKIFAPANGLITRKVTEVGALVQVGQVGMYFVPDQSVFVVANFKETQVNRIQLGQPVIVEVDGISGKEYKGKVESLAPATGSMFSLLPPDNATGNFVKVVQRVPVKIVLDESASGSLKMGMSVTVSVQVN